MYLQENKLIARNCLENLHSSFTNCYKLIVMETWRCHENMAVAIMIYTYQPNKENTLFFKSRSAE